MLTNYTRLKQNTQTGLEIVEETRLTPQQWQQVVRTFEAALDLPAEERSAFLAQASSDNPELRHEVESLLAEDERLGGTEAGTSMVGESIGAYRIVRLIGEGGMGKVYEAVRADAAFDRRVAIKLLQPGFLSQQLIQRFLLERRILARLHHPNVAALLDAGTTPAGQHYLVMEYVEEGTPITAYCRNRSLDLSDRVRLFQSVCEAVQYAHQNLVLHRDLKPQNILVTPDRKVKLLDFGIAKLMQPETLGSEGDLTMTAAAPMTLTYASPEQVRGEPVTTASDVYSLGVILYELICGARPYGNTALSRLEMERAICETEPQRPSVGARTTGLGDLDAIVMMALRKEPGRRYQSPAELKDDLDRYFDGSPVRARRSTWRYRAGKLVRRHRILFAAAAAVTIALAAGFTATLIEARIARQQRALAERRFGEIRKLANSFLFEFDGAISDLAGATAARQLVVRKSLEYLTALARESQGDRQLQTELATAYERVGDIQGSPILANLGDRTGALRSYREALRIRMAISARPQKAEQAMRLSLLHQKIGDVVSEELRHEEALAEYQAGLVVLKRLSVVRSQQKLVLMGRMATEFSMLGRRDEGAQWGQRSVEEARALFAAGMSEDARHDVSSLYARAGKALLRAGAIDAAVTMHQEEINLCEELVGLAAPEKNAHYRRDLAIAYRNLGDALLRKDQSREALALYERARPIQETLLKADAANSQVRMELSVTYSKLSEVLAPMVDLAGAEKSRANDLQLGRRLLNDDPGSRAYRRGYAYSLFQMGDLLRKQSRSNEARRYFSQQADVLKPLENEGDKSIQRQLLNCYRALAGLETDPRIAAGYLKQALAAAQKLADEAASQAIRQSLAGLSR
jgi:tRNA A-37 threonylcarbamoyl transferase component Bud32/tetratricopeptide (TPR) repeat protein